MSDENGCREFYSELEWCLTAILCNSPRYYIHYHGALQTHARRYPKNWYYYFEFSFCDDPTIVLHWYDKIPTPLAKHYFIKRMKHQNANKLIVKELENRQRRSQTEFNFELKTSLWLIGALFVFAVVVWGLTQPKTN
jgi:hypothetical protein